MPDSIALSPLGLWNPYKTSNQSLPFGAVWAVKPYLSSGFADITDWANSIKSFAEISFNSEGWSIPKLSSSMTLSLT